MCSSGRNERLVARLSAAAHVWSEDSHGSIPMDAESATNPLGQWSAAACGVAIRRCPDGPIKGTGVSKGMGAFATQCLPSGSVVGIYAGELLSCAGFRERHKRRWWQRADPERAQRLASLRSRAPMGGHRNGGTYVVQLASQLLVDWAAREDPSMIMYIDAEDADRSSWCRYINHADSSEGECNLVLRVAATPEPRAWLIAARDIAPG